MVFKTNKYINPDKIIKQFKHATDFINTSTRHFIQSTKNQVTKIDKYHKNKSFKEFRKDAKVTSKAAKLKINEKVAEVKNTTSRLLEGSKASKTLTTLASKKWLKPSLYGIGAILVASLIEKTLSGFTPTPAIPKNYERGYDIMEETMTDFGSPIKLLKAASKIITPYYSSVRKGIVTNTDTTIDRNLSLYLSKNAIRHNRY